MPNRIKLLREEKGMTQVRLSIELGVTQETISAYELGRYYPSIKSLLRMSALFDANVDYILGLSDIRKATPDNMVSRDESRIVALYRKMDYEQRASVYSFMQGQLNGWQ